jgi:mRNA-degrading endonuclease RelE of RelBE toxin-antitoxin system
VKDERVIQRVRVRRSGGNLPAIEELERINRMNGSCHNPSSSILFVSICSMNKAKGGQSLYGSNASLCKLIAPSLAHKLLLRRELLRQVLTTPKGAPKGIEWQGVPVSELEFNRQLTAGADFGGKEAGCYLPALHRYEGRFFQTLGMDGQTKMRFSQHHTLFLSGLYGLVSPNEPIQLYCCPLTPLVVNQWVQEDLLTKVLCDYTQRHSILRVFDLTAVMAYRNLVDWDLLCRKGTDVLHCFSTMSSGDSALIPFAQLMKRSLLDASEDELIGIKPELRLQNVVFRSVKETREGLPDELKAILEAERELPLLQSHRVEDMPEVLTGANVTPSGSACSSEEWLFSITSEFRKDCIRNGSLAHRLLKPILEICRDPTTLRGDTIKPLQGPLKGKWRYRVGDYRIVYLPDPKNRTIYLLKASARGLSGLYDSD